jgi:hypothetical protein
MRYALLLTLALCGCAGAVRRILILHEEITSKVGPDHVITRFDRSFIEANRQRITIEADFTVDATARINPRAFDGDIHIAGRSPAIGLRLVAEIKNAKLAPAAIQLVQEAERSRTPVRVRAFMRFWPEHAIGLPHRQGEPMPRLPNANPDHVFELHPVVRIGDIDLLASLRTVDGYRPGHASSTFRLYERSEVEIRTLSSRVYVKTRAGLWNDVHFLLELTDARPVFQDDGRYLFARARDPGGSVLVDSIRVVLLNGSPPELAFRNLRAGDRVHVWGLPRVSFDGLARLIQEAGTGTSWRTAKLPYEVLIIGIYPEGG